MKVQALEKVVDDPGPIDITVDAVENVAHSLRLQRGDFRPLAVWGDSGYAGGDTEANVAELTQLLHHFPRRYQ